MNQAVETTQACTSSPAGKVWCRSPRAVVLLQSQREPVSCHSHKEPTSLAKAPILHLHRYTKVVPIWHSSIDKASSWGARDKVVDPGQCPIWACPESHVQCLFCHDSKHSDRFWVKGMDSWGNHPHAQHTCLSENSEKKIIFITWLLGKH